MGIVLSTILACVAVANSQYVIADRTALLAARDAWMADPVAAAATYGAIGTWDVSRVTDMRCVFGSADIWGPCKDPNGGNDGAYTFNDDISGWDVSSVTTMNGMFYHARQFNQPLSTWDVSKVTAMYKMLNDNRVFNQPYAITHRT